MRMEELNTPNKGKLIGMNIKIPSKMNKESRTTDNNNNISNLFPKKKKTYLLADTRNCSSFWDPGSVNKTVTQPARGSMLRGAGVLICSPPFSSSSFPVSQCQHALDRVHDKFKDISVDSEQMLFRCRS